MHPPKNHILTNKQIRLLVIISDLSGGGAERVVSTILKEIDRERFEPMLALWRDNVVYPIPRDTPVRVLGKYRPRDLLKAIVRTRKLIAEWKPDAVYSHLSYVNFVTGTAIRSMPGRRPAWIACEHNNPYLSLPLFMRAILRLVYRFADRVVCVSKGVRDSVKDAFGLPEEKAVTVYNPLELPAFQPVRDAEPGCVKNPYTLVAMGRLTGQKDYPTMFRAIALLKDRLPLRLRVLGTGPDRDALQKLAADLGIAESVELTGFVKDPFPVIRASDVYVMSSVWEGLPTALIEAMACGVPAVSTRAEFGPEEIIVDGESGLLVDVGDYSALADAICRVLKDQGLRRRLAENGAARVRTLFSKDTQIRLLEGIVSSALSLSRARGF